MSTHDTDIHPEDSEPMAEQKVSPPTDELNPEAVIPLGRQQGDWRRPGGEGGRYVCKVCGKSFNSKAELSMHMESQHRVSKETAPEQA